MASPNRKSSKNMEQNSIKETIASLRPIFIAGTPKSGTTFLLSLLDNHPSVITLLESAVYNFKIPQPENFGELSRTVDLFFQSKNHMIHPEIKNDRIMAKAIEYIRNEKSADIHKNLLYALLASVIEELNGKSLHRLTHFVEKTPSNYCHADKIFADFPNARIIHLLRDPRDNYLSLKRRMRDSSSLLFQQASYHPVIFIRNRIIESSEMAYRNVNKFGERYRILYYEDLIYRGEKIVREIASWFRLPWHDTLLQPTRNGVSWKGNSFSPDLKGKLRAFDKSPIGRWKEQLSNREIALLECIIQAYNLQKQYHIKTRHSRLSLIFNLILPFQDELKLEIQNIRNMPNILFCLTIFRSLRLYWRRRLSIYLILAKRYRLSDNRLLPGKIKSHDKSKN